MTSKLVYSAYTIAACSYFFITCSYFCMTGQCLGLGHQQNAQKSFGVRIISILWRDKITVKNKRFKVREFIRMMVLLNKSVKDKGVGAT